MANYMETLHNNYEAYMRSVSSYKRISKEREKELSKIINNSKDMKAIEKAKEELITSNLLLVVKWANHYFAKYPYAMSQMDMISVGNLGLISSANLYRHTKASFGTYASIGIRRNILRAIKSSNLVRFPDHHSYYWGKMCDLEDKYKGKLNDDIIIKELNISSDFLDRLKNSYHKGTVSLESLHSDRDTNESNWEDHIADHTQEGKAQKQEGEDFLKHYFNFLDNKRRKTIECIYLQSFSYSETAKVLKMSTARIGQIHKSAINMLRKKIMDDVHKGKALVSPHLLLMLREMEKEKKEKADEHDKHIKALMASHKHLLR